MKFLLTQTLGLFLALTAYQPLPAAASSFTAKAIRSGDNLLSILRQNGFTAEQREKVLVADKGLRHLFLTLDTRYLVKRQGGEVELRMYDSQTSDAFRIVKKGGQVSAQKYVPLYAVTLQQVDGKVYGSLMGSLLAKVKSNWVASRFMDAYVFDMKSRRDIQRGARFSFTVERLSEAGQFVKYGEVLSTSLELKGKEVQKRFVKLDRGGVFFTEEDLSEDRPLFAPVDYIEVASGFKPDRLHPITKKRQPHLGIDFELPVGEPIYAPRNGVVARFGKNRAAGYYIVLRHSNGMETSYNHLHRIHKRIRKGLTVASGEVIGEVGCTGYCTRPHLHFAVRKMGRMVDPAKYLKSYPLRAERHLVARN